MCVIWCIHMCDMTHPYMWRDVSMWLPFIHMMWTGMCLYIYTQILCFAAFTFSSKSHMWKIRHINGWSWHFAYFYISICIFQHEWATDACIGGSFMCDVYVTWIIWRCTMCTTLQHTATHCNTLQHTATHCNTLYLTATHCNTLQHTVSHCISLYLTATHCNTLQHTATHCISLQHTATHCISLQHTATHCISLQYAATHCNTLQHDVYATWRIRLWTPTQRRWTDSFVNHMWVTRHINKKFQVILERQIWRLFDSAFTHNLIILWYKEVHCKFTANICRSSQGDSQGLPG